MRVTIELHRVSQSEYRARCPALPGCLVSACSPNMAQERMKRAVCDYLASLDVAVPGRVELQILDLTELGRCGASTGTAPRRRSYASRAGLPQDR